MLQFVGSVTDNSRGVIYNHDMFMVQATGVSSKHGNFARLIS
jgi:hypothetical protein